MTNDTLGWEMIEKFLALRKAKKLGPIWTTGQLVEFSDLDDPFSRRVLPIGEYRKLISYWYPEVRKIEEKGEYIERIGPKREQERRWTKRYGS